MHGLADAVDGISRAEVPRKAHKTRLARWPDGNILANFDLISLFAQVLKKLPFGHGPQDGFIYICPDDATPCGALLQFCPPFAVLLGFAFLWVVYYGKAIFPAKCVRCLLHIPVVLIGAVVLDAVHKGNCVYYKMVVQVAFFIQMGSDKHLVFLAPQFPRQPDTNFMRYFRGGLSGRKGLVAVICYGSIFLAKPLFDGKHFLAGCAGVAVDAGHKAVLYGEGFIVYRLRFAAVDGIRNYIRKAVS